MPTLSVKPTTKTRCSVELLIADPGHRQLTLRLKIGRQKTGTITFRTGGIERLLATAMTALRIKHPDKLAKELCRRPR